MMLGNINSIDTMGLVDGPGIRVVIFMQGCPLRCLFCHNPETWSDDEKDKWTAKDLVDYIMKYKSYFKKNGGVTFSGGEPLKQPEFLLECLKLCKKNNIHTCVDTSGVGTNYEEILDYTDLVLWDIKGMEKEGYKKMTGKNIEVSLEFLRVCQEKNKKMWIRQVIVPGINDNIEYILEMKKFIKELKNIEKVELLPYHTMAISKYEELNIPYRLKGVSDMDKEKCQKLQDILNNPY